MTNFNGIRIVPNSMMVVKKLTRIHGGYMNRWLIRAEVMVPSREVIHDRQSGCMYMHPALIKELTFECAKRGGL